METLGSTRGNCGIQVRGTQGERQGALLSTAQLRPHEIAESAFSFGREQLEIGIVQSKEDVPCARPGVSASPGGRAPEKLAIRARRFAEISDGDDDVIERLQDYSWSSRWPIT